ncbi:hypothetical protein WA577_003802, partial [Blastocystis sp. JDR]
AVSVPHTKLGDLDVSTLTLGTWQFGDTLLYQKQTPEVEARIVKNAFEVGINFFDTAEAYNDGVSEQALGNALKASGRERDEYVIATKVNGDNLKPKRLRPIFERSLENLQTDHVDILQIHWPNDQVPPSVYMPVIREFVEEGKVHAIGISNHGCQDMQTVLDTGTTIISNQLPYNLLNRVVEDSIIPFCQQRDIAVLAYSPLAQGLLTGKYTCVADCPPGLSRSRYFDQSRSPFSRHGEAGCEQQLFETLAALKRIAEAQQMTLAQLSLAWLRQKAPTTIIFGASKPEHVFTNAECVQYHLDEAVMREIDACTLPVKEALHGNPDLWNHT